MKLFLALLFTSLLFCVDSTYATQSPLTPTPDIAALGIGQAAGQSPNTGPSEKPGWLMRKLIKPRAKRIEKWLDKLGLLAAECDIILKKDGSEIEAKVVEINETTIKYRRCDYPDGPLITLNRGEIFMIKYANGSKEMFNEPSSPAPTVASGESKAPPRSQAPVDPQATNAVWIGLASMVLSIIPILGWVGGIWGFLKSLRALKRIRESNGKLRGRGRAILGMIFSILGFLGGVTWFIINLAFLL